MNELKELEKYLETAIDDCERNYDYFKLETDNREAEITALAQQLAYEAILRKVKTMMKGGE